MTVTDLTGQRFGRLTVIKRAESDKHGKSRWVCQCDCGNTVTVGRDNLRRGMTKSCGCLFRENLIARNSTHCMTRKHKLYEVWKSMRQRCNNPNSKAFKNYGGRGIRVCKRWNENFVEFFAWSLMSGYENGLEIDRINNDGDYCPENCRYTNKVINANNRRTTRFVLFDNIKMPLAVFAKYIGKTYTQARSVAKKENLFV